MSSAAPGTGRRADPARVRYRDAAADDRRCVAARPRAARPGRACRVRRAAGAMAGEGAARGEARHRLVGAERTVRSRGAQTGDGAGGGKCDSGIAERDRGVRRADRRGGRRERSRPDAAQAHRTGRAGHLPGHGGSGTSAWSIRTTAGRSTSRCAPPGSRRAESRTWPRLGTTAGSSRPWFTMSSRCAATSRTCLPTAATSRFR